MIFSVTTPPGIQTAISSGLPKMAIRQDATPLFQRMFRHVETAGRMLTFGRQKLIWDGAPTPEEFFKQFGFSEVHSLDISSYEGCTHIHDLNDPTAPVELAGQYSFVLSGGTLEHVFCVLNAIKVALDVLQEGGTFEFSTPCNNWIDHGFYQLSPTFKFDYVSENGLQFGESQARLHYPSGLRRVIPLYPGEGQVLNFLHARVGHVVMVKKVVGSTTDRIPKQGLYLDKHDGVRRRFRFRASEPFDVVDGMLVDHPMQRSVLLPSDMRSLHDCWAARYSNKETPASLPNRPFRSKALVYENAKLLDWIVSEPGMVRETLGSFCHFPGFIYFSTSDGTDPRTNGRRYEVAFPVGVDLRSGLPIPGKVIG